MAGLFVTFWVPGNQDINGNKTALLTMTKLRYTLLRYSDFKVMQ